MKNTHLIIATILIARSLFSYDTETRIKLDSKGSMEAQSFFDLPLSRSQSILLNPRLHLHKNNLLDGSLGIGYRHPVSIYTLGYYIYGDMSWRSPFLFYQISPGLEFLAPFFELRLNYYHPISQKKTDGKFSYTPSKWINLEGVLKLPYFQIDAGPTYNFKDKSLGSQFGITVPLKNFDIGCSFHKNSNNKMQSLFFVTLKLFNPEKKQIVPTRRNSGILMYKQRETIFPATVPPKITETSEPEDLINEKNYQTPPVHIPINEPINILGAILSPSLPSEISVPEIIETKQPEPFSPIQIEEILVDPIAETANQIIPEINREPVPISKGFFENILDFFVSSFKVGKK